MQYPTLDTLAEWDGASLFSVTGEQSAARYAQFGYDSLNEVERSLCCLFLFDAEVNNGGFGQWLWILCPKALAETRLVLRKIGATDMASFVASTLLQFGDLSRFKSRDDWREHLDSFSDEVHDHLETLSQRFVELEEPFLESVYAYTLANWESVRTA